ncbi:MAG TPA: ATP-dependent DNA ligase [Chitinophagales bacterium]|nr:ATP-dependent DNA ligase [Chitinophagales bacterium]
MKLFATLIEEVSASTKTNEKLSAIVRYFTAANEEDKIWALALFTGRRPKRTVNSTLLHVWCAELAGIPLWLFEESYSNVGDLGETIALALPESTSVSDKPLSYWMHYLIDLQDKTEEEKKEAITSAWKQLGTKELFVFNKLMSATFRIGVSQALVVNALAKIYETDAQVMTHRISGKWDPATITFSELVTGEHTDTDASKPYPFYLAYPVEEAIETLGTPEEWQAEWKWDGIRGQIIKRKGELFVWSRGEDLVTDKFPEYQVLKDLLPDGTALDGEIICFSNGQPLPFSALQTRIGRKNVSKKILQEAPVAFIAYDVLELNYEDMRTLPQSERRIKLEQLVKDIREEYTQNLAQPIEYNRFVLMASPVIDFIDWEQLTNKRLQSRENVSEGVMLKRKNAIYQAGRKRGDWWKWKVDPLSIDAVLVAAQKGSGRRASLYTDYTFAVRDNEGNLVTFAKAYSGLTDKEFAQVDAFIKKNIIEKFGPVRTVKPELVFEIGFEGIAESKRHKSGVAVRFPRMLRWRKDKPVEEINTLDDLKTLLKTYGTGSVE